eukprot:INCI13042.3.p1 GENE.INCI13042.3~~INCI13042.3.p1  ORF type:complete len:1029 (-),score=161.50 INCI13042.3:433-3519(-)
MPEFSTAKDIARQIPEDATCVLLGESTHGTEEFYALRAEITKYLIQNRGFEVVLCEADWPFMYHINEYIHRKKMTMFPRGPKGVRFPQWMWKNKVFADLIEWMRANANSTTKKVNLLGMDCYCKEESMADLCRFLEVQCNDRDLAMKVRCSRPEQWPSLLAKLQWEDFEDGPEAAPKPGLAVPASEGAATASHKDTSSAGTRYGAGISKLDHFSAEQNMECMIAAHEYYEVQRVDPPGSQASWNARDQHMATTLLRIKERLGSPKVIVWAHNSHVGDSTACPRGGRDFTRNETWNLGQMTRSLMSSNPKEKVCIVGFYTYNGTVRAAENWGQPGDVRALQPALPHSFEARMHALGVHKYFVKTQNRNFCYEPQVQPLKEEYTLVIPLDCAKVTTGLATNSGDAPALKSSTFIPVERKIDPRSGCIRLRLDSGVWVTECVPNRTVAICAVPSTLLRNVEAPPATQSETDGEGGAQAKAEATRSGTEAVVHKLCNFPMLQRWVGVSYKPDTEFHSHYGEMVMAQAYDMVVFVDRTTALSVDLSESKAEENSRQQNRRLMKEYMRIARKPIPNVEARPLETNILEWHFVLHGTDGPYAGGKYHGMLEFPVSFPMKPPAIKMLTPSGRFETNTRICLSMSDFHAEMWNPGWNVETILIGLLSFMYEESPNAIGSLQDTDENRRKFAQQSEEFNMRNEIYVELFGGGKSDDSGGGASVLAAGGGGYDEDEDEHTCRFCFNGGDDLITPCNCKGSTKYVHLECLKQWQRSVLLTQSTHPKYQTKIDEICNVCDTRFRVKGKSRREQLLEFTGTEVVDLVKRGNVIVTSRDRCDEHIELMKKHPDVKEMLSHWHKSVMYIVEADVQRDTVMAVNVTREIPEPPDAITERLPGYRQRVFNPRAVWNRKFKALVTQAGHNYISSVKHFIGGPVQPGLPLALIVVRQELMETLTNEATASLASGDSRRDAALKKLRDQLEHLRDANFGHFFGAMEEVVHAARCLHAARGGGDAVRQGFAFAPRFSRIDCLSAPSACPF